MEVHPLRLGVLCCLFACHIHNVQGIGAVWQYYYVNDPRCGGADTTADRTLALIDRCSAALSEWQNPSSPAVGFKRIKPSNSQVITLYKYASQDCLGDGKVVQTDDLTLMGGCSAGWVEASRNKTVQVVFNSTYEYSPDFNFDTSINQAQPFGVATKIYRGKGCKEQDLYKTITLFSNPGVCEPNHLDPVIYELNNAPKADDVGFFKGYVISGNLVVWQSYTRATCGLAKSPEWQAGELNKCTMDWDGYVSYMHVRLDTLTTTTTTPPSPITTTTSATIAPPTSRTDIVIPTTTTSTGTPGGQTGGNDGSSFPIAAVVGGIVGGLALIAIIFCCCFCCRRCRQKPVKDVEKTPPLLITNPKPDTAAPSVPPVVAPEAPPPRPPKKEPKACPRLGWITKEEFVIQESLGHGNFGDVSRGLLRHGRREYTVAIKRLRYQQTANGAVTGDSRRALQKEAETMLRLQHANVIGCIGLHVDMDDADGLYVILEYMALGDLHSHLKKSKRDGPAISQEERLWYIQEVAKGLAYLASNKIVHRDVAARNVLLGSPTAATRGFPAVKVSDFGLSQRLEGNYMHGAGGYLPVRWMAPESLDIHRQKWSEKSDVYSYAVLGWEVYTDGACPWSQHSDIGRLINAILGGQQMDIPENVPQDPEVGPMLSACWARAEVDRPTFQQILDILRCPDATTLPQRTGSEYLDVSPSADKKKAPANTMPNTLLGGYEDLNDNQDTSSSRS